jgi:hypothetical protein
MGAAIKREKESLRKIHRCPSCHSVTIKFKTVENGPLALPSFFTGAVEGNYLTVKPLF